MITIPDGRTLNINTAEGSAAFLEWSPDIMSKNIRGVSLETQPIEANKQTFLIFGCLAAHLPADKRMSVATSEKQALVDLAEVWCDEAPRSPRWAASGVLAADVQELLDCLTPWTQDPEFCRLLLVGGAGGALGAYARLSSRADLPSAGFLESMAQTANNCVVCTGLAPAASEGEGDGDGEGGSGSGSGSG